MVLRRKVETPDHGKTVALHWPILVSDLLTGRFT
jgi:hypothetical protein